MAVVLINPFEIREARELVRSTVESFPHHPAPYKLIRE